jgi:hypothetical protein
MRNVLIGIAAVGIAVATAAPAFSQDAVVKLRTGDRSGVAVRIGDHRDHVRHHRFERHYAACRVIIVNERRADGTRATRKIRRC